MSKHMLIYNTKMVHIRMISNQVNELDRFTKLYGKNRTALVIEAIQYWLNTQEQLYGKKLKAIESQEG